jgi:hypothetical protein
VAFCSGEGWDFYGHFGFLLTFHVFWFLVLGFFMDILTLGLGKG